QPDHISNDIEDDEQYGAADPQGLPVHSWSAILRLWPDVEGSTKGVELPGCPINKKGWPEPARNFESQAAIFLRRLPVRRHPQPGPLPSLSWPRQRAWREFLRAFGASLPASFRCPEARCKPSRLHRLSASQR